MVTTKTPDVKLDPKKEGKAPDLSPLTPDEKALASRISGPSNDWQTINERDVLDFSLSEDPFKLPPPALKLEAEKKFKFRWFSRSPQRADEVKSFAKVRRWWVVNGVQPVGGLFDEFIDSTTGGIHLHDQLLFFKPWWLWKAEEKVEASLADSQVKLEDKDETEKNDYRLVASKSEIGGKAGRERIVGSDVVFPSEDEVDRELGKTVQPVSEKDLTYET